MRPLVNIVIKIGESVINTDITLAKTSRMTYPVLIGRSSLIRTTESKKIIPHRGKINLENEYCNIVKK